MSIFEAIVNYFNEHIDTTSTNIEALTPHLAEAANLMGHTLIQNHKIMTVTAIDCFAAGHQFNHNIFSNSKLARPALPAIFLNHANLANNQIADNDTIYSQQISALGQEGDLLFLLAAEGNEKPLLNSIESALQRGMNVISINSGDAQDIARHTPKEHVHISFSSQSPLQASNMHFLLTQLLSDLVEQQLFGGAL